MTKPYSLIGLPSSEQLLYIQVICNVIPQHIPECLGMQQGLSVSAGSEGVKLATKQITHIADR